MHEGAREEFTDIRVDSRGAWFTGEKKIINEEVLRFFRANLYRDKKGIYVFNEFRGFKEKGYIKVEGPVMMVEQISSGSLILSDGTRLSLDAAELAVDASGVPYVKIERLGAWAGFPARSAHAFASGLQEQGKEFFWQGRRVVEYQQIPWVFHEN